MWKQVSDSIRGRMAPCGELPLCSIEAVISERRLAGLAGKWRHVRGSECLLARRVSSSYSKGSLPVVAAVKASCIQLSKPEGHSVSSRATKSTESTYAAKTTL